MLRPLFTYDTPLQGPTTVLENVFGAPGDGPEVVVVAGLHGDEVAGTYAAALLCRHLATLAPRAIRGFVRVVPVVNVDGFDVGARAWPADQLDLNRTFPGWAAGDTVQRMTARLFEAVRSATYGIDLHGSNAIFEEEPHVRLTEPGPDQLRKAAAFGLPFVFTTAASPVMKATLVFNWQVWNVTSFTLLGGLARNLGLGAAADKLYRALYRFLVGVGVVDDVLPPVDPPRVYPHTHQAVVLNGRPGLLVPKVALASRCARGDVLAEVLSVTTGAVEEAIVAPFDGLVAGLRRYPVLASREMVARILADEAVGDGGGVYFQQ